MKISKLFHWLYGLVMLLPIFAIGVTCGYAMFNKNAYQSYMGSADYLDTIKYEEYITNKPVNANSYELNGTTYYYYSSTNFNNIEINTDNPRGTNDNWNGAGFIMFNCNSFTFNNTEYTDVKSVVLTQYEYNFTFFAYDVVIDTNYFYIPKVAGNNNYGLYYLTTGTPINHIYTTASIYSNPINIHANLNLNNIYSDKLVTDSKNYYKSAYFDLYLNDTTISSVFYHSINKVTQSNLFSWSYNSFLVAPFTYIVGLFSMPTNSPVVMLLSYWLSISIIWLVFDLVMYVPLLVHRWLDKGAIE